MFGRHFKRPAPQDLKPAGHVPSFEMREVLKATVERLYARSKALAIVDQEE